MLKTGLDSAINVLRRKKPGRSYPGIFGQGKRKTNHRARDLAIKDCSFTVLDTELTGLNPKADEIVSIGAVKIRFLSIEPENIFYAEVKPKQLPKACTLIHGISPDQVREAPQLEEVMPELLSFVGHDHLVGHNIGLDMAFLNRACKRHLGVKLDNPCIDTLRLARVYSEQQWQNYFDRYDLQLSLQLNDLAQKYGLPQFAGHNAFQDALQTAYLFLFLLKKLSNGQIKTLKQLYCAGKRLAWM